MENNINFFPGLLEINDGKVESRMLLPEQTRALEEWPKKEVSTLKLLPNLKRCLWVAKIACDLRKFRTFLPFS